MKAKIAIIAAVLWFSLYSPVPAQESWQTDIQVSVSDAQNRLSLGQKLDASDGWNTGYDVPALLSGDIMAYLEEPGDRKYWRKFKASCDGHPCIKKWDVVIESDLGDQTIKMEWNFSSFPADMAISLIDEFTGNTINMKTQTEYTYKNNGKRRFQVEAQR
jgi:hypothetical protein